MQQESIRPISTYDNLSASIAINNKASKPKGEPLCAGESSGPPRAVKCIYDNYDSNVQCDSISTLNESLQITPSTSHQPLAAVTTTTTDRHHLGSDQFRDLNETSHSVAAARAALIDAKCKFFGINNYDTLDAAVPSLEKTNLQKQMHGIKPEHKNQNVPPSIHVHVLSDAGDLKPMKEATSKSSQSPDRSLRYGATYEQIPLRDSDELQPSQAVYMSTTVPQNMKGISIAGRHTPTRNSLRHSRMIVVNNKSQHTNQESYSTDLRNLYFSRQLLILQLAIGLLLGGLALWILIRSPNASILLNPYLSGLSLLFASIVGLILLGQSRRVVEYNNTPNNNCYKVLIAELYVFSALALIFCCLALVCAAIKFAELTSTNGVCGPATSSILSYHNCTCLVKENQHAGSSELLNDEANENVNNSIIQSCAAIRKEWKYLLGFSMALNTLGMLATLFYLAMLSCFQNN
ncbi:uncharacterized protein LOC117794331 isoform X2 [Drosophila innubila]|uniref:uncharacterized protein LOC117794331 isoform X2 n=1 Tax=Drosophila innubila TaxID=198719 RepID=UPI00148B5EDC|nr:uncharacterized protein LOC117794331 isoform X2 [Drosophila innubila]